ncbi:MAG: hypothetical protein ABI588_06040 [Arenimonas sp.]
MTISLLLAAALVAAPLAPAPEPQAAPDPRPLDLLPAFIGACIDPGPDAKKIRDAVVKAGGQSAPEQPGKDSADPSRLSGYSFPLPKPYSVIFNGTGTCAIVSREADVEVTKGSLAGFVAGSTAVFDINIPNHPEAKPGETIVSAYVLTSRQKVGTGMSITLSKVTRDGASAIFLSRHLVAIKP